MKKTIKIKICNHTADDIYLDTYSYGYFLVKILKKFYIVELSEEPDYIFYNETLFEYLKYDCIKIYYTGENITPNFNTCDYAIGYDHLTFEDRYYRLPIYLVTVFYNKDELALAGQDYLGKQTVLTNEDLRKKSEFCSFVYSNYRADIERKSIFKTLSTYKKVNSAGAYLNNNGGIRIGNKLAFEANHKFSVAFENSSRSGYTTEKIVGSLTANTIPIYWGNPRISEEFNKKRFINCHDYNSFDEVLDVVKKLDQNDDLYLEMVNQPTATKDYNFQEVRDGFELFLKNIFDQPLEKAKRCTINQARAAEMEDNERAVHAHNKKRLAKRKFLAMIYRPLKKLQFIENLKESYFKRKVLK